MKIMQNLKKKFKKDGGTVMALVIVLMLIFPFIISGLMDITNCSILKRQLKQQLNSATKAAANSVDIKATRNGVYRIADGVLCTEVYGKSIASSGVVYYPNNYYKRQYYDSAEVFFTILEYNNMIGTGTAQSVWDSSALIIDKGTYKNGYIGCVNESYSPICTYSMTGNKTSNTLKRNTRVFFTVVNNGYEYNSKLENYMKINENQAITPIEIPISTSTGLSDGNVNTWANWNPSTQTGEPMSIYVYSHRPTAVGMAVIEYEPSKIFSFFGKNFEKIYIKEYATAELIVNENYWQ